MGWRGDVRDSFYSGLLAYQVANPTLVDRALKARPASLVESRTVYIGGMAETIEQDPGTQRRAVEVTLVCCAQLGENTEVTDDLEDMADGLVDYLTANPHLTGSSTYQEPVRTTTTEVPEGGTFIPAIAVVARAYIEQGRT